MKWMGPEEATPGHLACPGTHVRGKGNTVEGKGSKQRLLCIYVHFASGEIQQLVRTGVWFLNSVSPGQGIF